MKLDLSKIKLKRVTLFLNFHEKYKDVVINYPAGFLEHINIMLSVNGRKQMFLPGVLYCLLNMSWGC